MCLENRDRAAIANSSPAEDTGAERLRRVCYGKSALDSQGHHSRGALGGSGMHSPQREHRSSPPVENQRPRTVSCAQLSFVLSSGAPSRVANGKCIEMTSGLRGRSGKTGKNAYKPCKCNSRVCAHVALDKRCTDRSDLAPSVRRGRHLSSQSILPSGRALSQSTVVDGATTRHLRGGIRELPSAKGLDVARLSTARRRRRSPSETTPRDLILMRGSKWRREFAGRKRLPCRELD